MALDKQGENLLALLVERLDKAIPGQPQTYIGYKQCHDALGLTQQREKWGESLKPQGLSSLADWTEETGLPGITGLIINLSTNEPGKGYFNLFGRDENDYAWWSNQIKEAKEFDWSPYITEEFDLVPIDFAAPDREDIVTSRIIRDTGLSVRVKALNRNECQIGGLVIDMPAGKKYSEAHHIKPLGKPHNGPDIIENMICVCPNHHAILDYGAINLEINEIISKPGHEIAGEFISYHNAIIYKP